MQENDRNPIVVSAGAQRRPRRRSRIIPLVVSVVLAFCLWFYVMAVESPVYEKTFSLVPVTIVQGDSALSVYSGNGATVELVVSGKKSVLNQLSADDFTVNADISGYTSAGRYTVPLSFMMPEGATRVSSSIDSLALYLDSRTSVSVPVTVKFTDYTLDDGYEIGENALEKSADEVVVTGPSSVVTSIQAAQLTASLGHVTTSKKVSGKLELIGADGVKVDNPYLSTDITDVEVRVPVYVSRDMPLTVEYKYGFFNSSNSKVTVSPQKVTVKGEVDVIKAMDSLVAATIDEKTAQSGKTTVALTPPEGITVTDGTTSVEINITLTGLVTKTVAVTNISVKNPSGSTYKPTSDSVNITLRGPADAIDAITADDISVSVDVSGVTANQKTMSGAAKVTVSDTYSSSVYELGEYMIQLESK